MRLVGAVLFVALSTSSALADDAKPARPRVSLRLVRVLPETRQALLFDKAKSTHILVEVGQTVDGMTIEDIDDDEVVASVGATEVILAAPLPQRTRPEPKPAADPKDPEPQDPYPEAPVRTVEAPDAADVRVAEAPTPAPVAAPAPAPAPAAAPAAAPAPAPAPIPDSLTTTIPRAQFTSALSDFGKLAAAFHGELTADGVRFDLIGDTTIFARAGLRAGDVVRAVDNQPLRSLDDAADLYARAASARNITVQVVRGGKPLTLRVTIQ